MTTTNNYGITLLEASQAQKEITINEALGVLDAVLKSSVLDKDLATPPASPAAGDAYIVTAGATGLWAGKSKAIAYYDQIWRFITPQNGLRVWVADEQIYYQYNGTAWASANPAVSSIAGNAATATALQTARTINGVSFDGTANITVSTAAPNLTGEVTSVGVATTVTNGAVISKLLTGYASGSGMVAATDTILQAIQKINGNDALKAPIASPTFTGTVTLPTGQVVNGVTLSTASGVGNFLRGDGTYGAASASAAWGSITGTLSTQTDLQNALNLKANLASPTFSGTVSGVTAAMVGAPSGSGTSTGTNTGDQTTIAGNAATATALQTARLINGVSFNGSTDITVTAAAGTLTGAALSAGVTGSSLTSVGTITTGVWNGTAIAAANGGTGQTVYAIGDLLQASTTTALSRLASIATGNALISGGVGVVSSWGKVGLTTHVSGTLPAANGGTGQAVYAVGDVLFASTTTALSKLADVATGNALISGGVGVAPAYGKIGLTTHVSGTLPVANGGTGDAGTAWTAYTPTVAAGSGAFTTVNATGRHKLIGKTCFFQINVNIVTNGTAAGWVTATLPFTASAFAFAAAGRETAVTGNMLNVGISVSGATALFTKYDATYPGANGYTLTTSGMYETV